MVIASVSAVIGFLVLIIILGVSTNNKIIEKKNRTINAFGSIEIYLKKRFDLIPNLVSLLNKYLAHEKDILLKVTELRGKVDKAQNSEDKLAASNELTNVMSGLNINVENYPNLKADRQFLSIQYELMNLEDQISAARRAYNASVIDYNNKIQMFPASIIAGIRKDDAKQILEIPKSEQKEVNIGDLLQ